MQHNLGFKSQSSRFNLSEIIGITPEMKLAPIFDSHHGNESVMEAKENIGHSTTDGKGLTLLLLL